MGAKPEGRRHATPSAHIERITRTREKQLRESKRSASIRSMRRWVWPIADATRALKAAIRGSVAKAATATLRYEAFEARHCVRAGRKDPLPESLPPKNRACNFHRTRLKHNKSFLHGSR